MLVKITDRKGKDHYIHPLYVKMVKAKNEQITEDWGSFLAMGSRLQTEESVDSVVDRISLTLAALGVSSMAAVAVDQDAQAPQAQAAAAAG